MTRIINLLENAYLRHSHKFANSRYFMKKDVHPKYFPKAKVKCACGNVFEVGSTKPEISVEICSKCHPFFSGEGRVIDTAGRIERYKKMMEKAKKGKR